MDQLGLSQNDSLEEQLKQCKEIVTMFSNTIIGGVAKISIKDMSIITATDGYYQLTGYSRAESLLPPFSNCGMNLVIKEDLEELQDKVNYLITENKPIKVDYRIRKKDGSIAWNSGLCSSVQSNEDGQYIEVFFLDTTQDKNNEIQLISLIDNLTSGLIRMKFNSKIEILYANNEFYRQIGYTYDEFNSITLNNDFSLIVYEEDLAYIKAEIKEFIISHKNRKTMSYRIVTKNNQIKWIKMQISRLYEEIENELIFQCILTDITKDKEKEKQILLNEEKFRIISEQTRDIIFDWNIHTDEITYSPVYQKVFGSPPPKSMTSLKLLKSDIIHNDDKEILKTMIQDIKYNVPYSDCRIRLRKGDGTFFWALHRATAIREDENSPEADYVIGIVSDVNDLMEDTINLKIKAEHDDLTGLLNRATGQTIIENILTYSKSNTSHVFIQFDIDKFKQINDFMGHAAGDLALKLISSQIKEIFKKTDVLIRMGGDEFAVFIKDIHNINTIHKRIETLRDTIFSDFQFEEKIYPLSISIGAAFWPQDGSTFDELYKNADIAMYQAKRNGGNKYVIFNDELKKT